MWIYVVLSIIILFVAIIFTVMIVTKNKFQVLVIKINEAEENIELLLKEKYSLLVNVCNVMKNKNNDNSFEGIESLNIDELDHFELNENLSKYDNSVIELSEFNKDIEFSDEEKLLFDKLADNNVNCLATMKYYNDNVTKFNSLIESFPSSIVAKFKKFKSKNLYKNEKEEIFEILKK